MEIVRSLIAMNNYQQKKCKIWFEKKFFDVLGWLENIIQFYLAYLT